MAYALANYAGKSIFLLESSYLSSHRVFFNECKLGVNRQQAIYDNGKTLPQVYRERVLDQHHQGFRKGIFHKICELASET